MGRVKTEWRTESLGWFDGRELAGAGFVLHRPLPRVERLTLAYVLSICRGADAIQAFRGHSTVRASVCD